MMATALARARICLKSARPLRRIPGFCRKAAVDLIGNLEYKRIVRITLSGLSRTL
jgi:hypothetical protein